ncbi:unnamed protein product [Lasius platythorax]|uniref:Uncharacterized protein n=1 Tax=Lasius platythorax TaxID=488582 RepID=A0AAV2MWV5_9HYME
MGDISNLVSNEISNEIFKEPTESVIEVTENEPNPSSSRLNCEENDIDWKKKYEKLNDLYKKREKTYDGVLRKYNKFHNILKEKVKKLNAEKISLHKQCVKMRKS